jgi:hypothetical protein
MKKITIDYDDYLELAKESEALRKITHNDAVIRIDGHWDDVQYIFCQDNEELRKILEKYTEGVEYVNKLLEIEKKYEKLINALKSRPIVRWFLRIGIEE